MAAEKSPAFQFYPKEFLMDGNVAAMSLQERGAYITLICICWQEKSIPSDVRRLANIVGVPVRPFEKMWPQLSQCFVLQGDRLFHPRLEKERQKQADFSRRQSDKGKASAANRASTGGQPEGNRGSTTAQPDRQPEGNSPISDLRSPERTVPPNPPGTTSVDVLFQEFLDAYPPSGRRGGFMVQQAFIEALERVGFTRLMTQLQQHKRSEQWGTTRLIPSMKTWFEEQRWLQDLPEPEPAKANERVASVLKHTVGNKFMTPDDEPL